MSLPLSWDIAEKFDKKWNCKTKQGNRHLKKGRLEIDRSTGKYNIMMQCPRYSLVLDVWLLLSMFHCCCHCLRMPSLQWQPLYENIAGMSNIPIFMLIFRKEVMIYVCRDKSWCKRVFVFFEFLDDSVICNDNVLKMDRAYTRESVA